MTSRLVGLVAALACAAGCALDDAGGEDELMTSEIEHELVNGCTASVATPWIIGRDVYTTALVQNCAYTTSIHTLIRIDIPIFSDKTVAEQWNVVYPGSYEQVQFSGRCNWRGWKTIFAEVRLYGGGGSSKLQSRRAELYCP